MSKLVSNAIANVIRRAADLPAMRKLRVIEWFAGSARMTAAFARYGCETIYCDTHPDRAEAAAFGRFLVKPVLWKEDFLNIGATSVCTCDYMHFSPDCRSFSNAAGDHHGRFESNDFLGVTEVSALGNRLLAHSLFHIQVQLDKNPEFLFTLENPEGKMENDPSVKSQLEKPVKHGGLGATKCVLDYCWFSDSSMERTFRKRTHFWTNSKELIREFGAHDTPNWLCTRDTPCPCFGGHKPVQGNTKEATPFPPALADLIARLVCKELAPRRYKHLERRVG